MQSGQSSQTPDAQAEKGKCMTAAEDADAGVQEHCVLHTAIFLFFPVLQATCRATVHREAMSLQSGYASAKNKNATCKKLGQ